MSGIHLIHNDQVFAPGGPRLRVMRQPEHGSQSRQHRHDFYELVVVLRGHGVHAVGPVRHALEAGDVFTILPKMTHGYPESDGLSLVNILYDPETLGIPEADLGSVPGYHALFTVEPRIRDRNNFRNRLRLNPEQLAHTAELVAFLEEELLHSRAGREFMAITFLMQLTAYLARCYSVIEPAPGRPVSQISEVLGYMERHYSEPLGVEDLVKVAHMSKTSLMRTFRRIMGRAPIEHLIRLRIARACALLRQRETRITEIALAVGFNDSNYFSRQFRRVMGFSPRDFRRIQAHGANHRPGPGRGVFPPGR